MRYLNRCKKRVSGAISPPLRRARAQLASVLQYARQRFVNRTNERSSSKTRLSVPASIVFEAATAAGRALSRRKQTTAHCLSGSTIAGEATAAFVVRCWRGGGE